MSRFPRRPKPSRYLMIDGHWYVLKEHMARQLEVAAHSAFEDGAICAINAEAVDPAPTMENSEEIITLRVRGDCGKVHQSVDEWANCKICEHAIDLVTS